MTDLGSAKLGDMHRHALVCWRQNKPERALDVAWAAFDLAPDECASKALLVRLLRSYPTELQNERRLDYLRLLTDRKVEPDLINSAGWRLVLGSYDLGKDTTDADLEALASSFEGDRLALTLLRESPVHVAAAERLLTRLRRWLLLSHQWRRYPGLVAALNAQATLNGGAWPFDEAERALLTGQEVSAMMAAYLPARESCKRSTAADKADPVTRAVAAQYEGWPYPAWTRVTVGAVRRLPDVIADMDLELAKTLPVEADMLVAGCGTGRQAASVALKYPDAKVTAIDVSESSLDYARRQCMSLGIDNVRFIKLDLHNVSDLQKRFHAIHTAGVLHHLSDPERGLKLLADILYPGGVMHIMLYNRYQRLMVSGARTFLIADLLQEPISDDLLRRVRQRFLEQPSHPAASYVIRSRDFATLAGTHDLLLHRHEDSFDAKRIGRALDQAGLRLLSFDMPSPTIEARYETMFPRDPEHRDIELWERFTLNDPLSGQRHYRFWCYMPPGHA